MQLSKGDKVKVSELSSRCIDCASTECAVARNQPLIVDIIGDELVLLLAKTPGGTCNVVYDKVDVRASYNWRKI